MKVIVKTLILLLAIPLTACTGGPKSENVYKESVYSGDLDGVWRTDCTFLTPPGAYVVVERIFEIYPAMTSFKITSFGNDSSCSGLGQMIAVSSDLKSIFTLGLSTDGTATMNYRWDSTNLYSSIRFNKLFMYMARPSGANDGSTPELRLVELDTLVYNRTSSKKAPMPSFDPAGRPNAIGYWYSICHKDMSSTTGDYIYQALDQKPTGEISIVTLNFGNGGGCVGKPQYSTIISGNGKTGAIMLGTGNNNQYELDISNFSLSYIPTTQAMADSFNTQSFCSRNDWQLNVERIVTPSSCGSTIGTTLYTSIRRSSEQGGVILGRRTTGHDGSTPAMRETALDPYSFNFISGNP